MKPAIRRRRHLRRLVSVIPYAALLCLPSGHLPTYAFSEPLARVGVCSREGEKLVGQKPVKLGRSVRGPKKIRDVRPKYPNLPPKTVGSGIWVGEALIDEAGRVAHVWPIRQARLTPPFPGFHTAITDAIRQWEFDRFLVHGKVVPLCMTVVVNLHWE